MRRLPASCNSSSATRPSPQTTCTEVRRSLSTVPASGSTSPRSAARKRAAWIFTSIPSSPSRHRRLQADGAGARPRTRLTIRTPSARQSMRQSSRKILGAAARSESAGSSHWATGTASPDAMRSTVSVTSEVPTCISRS